MLKIIKKILILAIALNLSFSTAYGQLATDGTTNTQITSGEFNTPVINIAAPNDKGLSHNKFTDYNVGSDNLIINNNREQNKISKIGGYVKENPNLVSAGREANIVLNEVTGTGKTNLNGYTEMLGKNADLVIANPNGINIAGAGFINIPKVTLVTGSSNISAEGELESFNLSDSGIIDISKDGNNLGLSAEDSSLYLSGRYVKIGGNIYANIINILTGSKSFNYLTKEADSYAPSSAPAATEYAVDASSLGGMYSGVINIIGTEEGFGVRNSATLVTDIGDIKIINKGITEAENISSGNALYIESDGILTAGNIDVKGNMNISARNITLNGFKTAGESSLSSSGGNIFAANGVSGGDLSVLSTNNISAHSISSNADIIMSSANTLTYNALKAARDINLSAFNITHEGISEAGSNINILADSFNINPAAGATERVLLAYGDINFDVGTLNNTGEIAAFKDIKINSNTLNNNGLILANNILNIEGGNINNNSGASLFGNNALNIKTDGTIINTLGTIYGNNILNIQGLTGQRSGDLTNKGGTIESRNGDVNISAANIYNLSIDNCDPDTGMCYTASWVNSGEVLKWIYNLCPTPIPYIIEKKQVATSLLASLSYGKIISGKNINLTATDVRNESGIISASNTININASNLHNIRPSFDVTLQRQMYFPGISGLTIYIEPRRWTETFSDTIFSTTPAIISAQSVIINATGTVFNDAYKEGESNVPLDPLPVSQNFQDVVSNGIINPVSSVDFSYSGLFKPAGPDSSYLYVTTNRFLDKRNYVGADYFFTQTGIDYNKQSTKLIGDVFYEQKLIEDSILRLTGSRSLNNYSENMNNQMTSLYNNAAQAYGDLGLSFGQALTAEQSAKLSKDIIWYVEQDINGTKVYVPTLYLAKASKEKLAQKGSESSIEGNNTLIISSDIVNSGNITADDLQLYAKGDIKNISGTIKANDNLDISAQGNISNESKRNLVKYAPVSAPMTLTLKMVEKADTETTPDKFPWKNATISSGGNLNITAGNKFESLSGNVSSVGDMTIYADKEIGIKSQELNTNGNISNQASNLNSFADIYLYSGGKLDILGSNVEAKNALTLSGSEVNILSNIDETHEWRRVKKTNIASNVSGAEINVIADKNINVTASNLSSLSGNITFDAENVNVKSGINSNTYSVSSGSFQLEDSSTNNDGSTIDSSNDINVVAEDTFELTASDLSAANNINILAKDVNIQSGQDTTHYYRYNVRKRSFGRKKIEEDRRDTITNVSSDVTAGGSLNINSYNDIKIIGSNLTTGSGSMVLQAGNDIDVLAGINQEATLTRREKRGAFGLSGSKDVTYDNIKTLESSSVFSGDDIKITSGADTTLFASNVGAKGDGSIKTGGDLNIFSGVDSTYHYEEHIKRTFDPLETLKSIAENLYSSSGPLGMISEADKLKDAAKTGRYEVFNVNLYNETRDTLETYNETLRASTLNFGGKLDLTSAQDANIKGSTVNAEGGIDINAENINITSQELLNTSKTEHEDKQVSLSAGISNAYLNTALTLNAAKDAAEDLKKAQETYNKIKDLYDQGKATKSALNDAKQNLALATTNLAMQTYAAASAVGGMSGSAATSFGTGMQGDLGLSASINKSSSQSSGSTQAGSNLWSNDDINLTSTKDINQQGSSIVSGQITETGISGGGDINYKAGGDINIEASANTNNTSSSSSSQSGSIGATTGGSANVNYSQNKSSSTSNDLWWTNSTAATGDGSINISSGDDTAIKGANLFGKNISINTGGDLLVESLQDEHHSSGRSGGFSGSFGASGNTSTYVPSLGSSLSQGGITLGGGINQSSNGADSAWVNNQTTIIGKDSVTVTADTTNIKGGVIANINENGQDGGNLRLNTNKLEYSDIKDYSNSYESGWGIQTNLPINTSGGQGALDRAKDSILHPSGSTTVTQKDASTEKEQETRATIGEGNITIDGKEATEEQTDGLNRDTQNTQEITKDQVTGALDYNITVDHQLTAEAVKLTGKIIKDAANLTKEQIATIASFIDGVLAQTDGESSQQEDSSSNQTEATGNSAIGHNAADKDTNGQDKNNSSSESNSEGGNTPYTSKPVRDMVVSQKENSDGSITVTLVLTQLTLDENGQAIYEQVTKEQTFPKGAITSDSSSVSIQSPYTISFDNMGQKEIDNLFVKAFGGNAPGSTYNHATVDLTNPNAVASMPQNLQNMLGQAVDDVNAFLAKNWDNSEARIGMFGVQEAMWSSIPGQTVSGTFGVIGDAGRLSLDSIAWGGIQLGKQAGLLDNVNTDYELNVFSNSAGTIGQWYVDNVNEERRKDLNLLGDIITVYGGAKIVSGGLADTSKNILKTGPTAPTYYRYMSEAEVNAINETGLLRGGIPGETYFTTDLYRTGAKAKKRLSLSKTPTQRVELEILNNPKMERNGTKVIPANGQPGKGTEFMTNDPVKVKIINNQPLRE